jgi:hypothetical protein
MAVDIDKTFIGTSDPPSICKGKALFPPFPDVGAGVSINQSNIDLINSHPQVLAVRGKFLTGFNVAMGFCGPGWALASDVTGRVDGQDLTLTISDWQLQAGVFLGFDFTFKFEAKAQVWKFHWSTVFDFDTRFTFDLIRVVSDIIRAVLDEGKIALLKKVQSFSPDLKSSWGMFAENHTDDNISDQNFRVEPIFTVPINLWPLLIQLGDEIGVGEVLTAINRGLEVTGSSISFGPVFGVNVPVRFQWAAIHLDGVEYEYQPPVRNSQWNGSSNAQLGGTPKNIKVDVQHETGFDFSMGVFGKLQILEVFHLGGSLTVPILSLLGINVVGGPQTQSLSNNVGDVTAFMPGGSHGRTEVEFV